MPYTLAVFKGETKNPEKRNPHGFLVISERINDGIERPPEQWFIRANKTTPERGGALKSRAINRKRWIYHTRQEWALEANRALQRAGREERIDHRSLAERFMEAMQEYKAAKNDPTQSEAERVRLLERAAELSREPEAHRGPQKRRKWRANQR